MKAEDFAIETTTIINEHRKAFVNLYLKNGGEPSGAILNILTKISETGNEMGFQMKQYYVSDTVNNALLGALEPFMLEKIRANPEKIYVIFIYNELVACHFLVDDYHVVNN